MTFTMPATVEISEDNTEPTYRFTLTSKEPPPPPPPQQQQPRKAKTHVAQQPSTSSSSGVRRRRSLSSASTNSSAKSIVSPTASSSRASSSSFASTSTGDPLSSHDPYTPANPYAEYVLAMHDFTPQVENATCLSFRAGQVIHVLNHDDSGWWDGELDGRRGWFPSNYVEAGISPASLIQEGLPRSRKGHTRASSSVGSTASWASAAAGARNRVPGRRRPSALKLEVEDMNRSSSSGSSSSSSSTSTQCPPVMVPLLQALSLLQSAVRTTKPTHFQPSTAYIISCVRGILQQSGCLERESPLLKEYPILARQRKGVLEELAGLVNQAKKASEYAEEVEREEEEMPDDDVDLMLRLGGQVFAHVRRFVAIVIQCGIDIPGGSTRRSESSEDSLPHGPYSAGWGSRRNSMRRISVGTTFDPDFGDEEETFRGPQLVRNADAVGRTPRAAARTIKTAVPMTPSRAKSLGDLRQSARWRPLHDVSESEAEVPLLPTRFGTKQRTPYTPIKARAGGKFGHSSESSTSSTFSETSYVSPPNTRPPFPSGPSSAAQVLSAMKSLHDTYLSTIAAFIGHVHSHSRTSHAAATGHLYDLVREIVEVVCRILCLTDAVLAHPGVPRGKMDAVRDGKQALYDVTSHLADLVRLVTTATAAADEAEEESSIGEEQEKQELLRTATNALKIGTDCVTSVFACLHRTVGNAPFVVQLQFNEEQDSAVSRRDGGDEEGENMLSPPLEVETPISPTGSFSDLRARAFESDEEDEKALPHPPIPTAGSESSHTSTEVSSLASGMAESFSSSASLSTSSSIATDASSHARARRPTLSLRVPPTIQEGPDSTPVSASAVSFSSMEANEDAATNDHDVTLTTWEAPMRRNRDRDSNVPPMSADKELPSVPLPTISEVVPIPIDQQFRADHSEEDIALNSDKLVVGATLPAIVEKMTPHDAKPDPVFSAVFWLTFRLFSSPAELVQLLIARYNIVPAPSLSQEERFVWQQQKGMPTRLRVFNFIKLWLEAYWKAGDDAVLPALEDFVDNALRTVFPGPSQRLLEIIRMRKSGMEMSGIAGADRIRDAGMPVNPPRPIAASDIPRPNMTKTLFSLLRNKNFAAVSVLDFDTLELARQLTCWECRLYSALPAEEILSTGQEGALPALHVKAVTGLSTHITGWVTEHVLCEQDTKKRAHLLKFFIKLADRCTRLQNYSTSRSILAALDSSTISRLHQTWQVLPQKSRAQLEALRKLADHARNYHEYRSRLRNTTPPAVPFLGLYLTDITFCREGNPSTRASPLNPDKKLLNFNKYHKLARIVQDLQRFQVPYNLKEIPEVQDYLKHALEKSHNHGNIHDLYRRSLMVEPRNTADIAPTPTSEMKQFFSWNRLKDAAPSAS